MGSTGSGNFGDYSGKPNQEISGGVSGGSSGDDKCRKAFSTGIEDLEDYSFFSKTAKVPAPGSKLTLAIQGRVVALDPTGLTIGALPTKFNYLAACLEDGISYTGVVTSSGMVPLAHVSADFVAD